MHRVGIHHAGVHLDLQGICLSAWLKVFSFPTVLLGRADQPQRGLWCWRCWTRGTQEPARCGRNICASLERPTSSPQELLFSVTWLWHLRQEDCRWMPVQWNTHPSEKSFLRSVEWKLQLFWWEHVMLGRKKGGGSPAKEIQCNNYLTKPLICRCHQPTVYASSFPLLGAASPSQGSSQSQRAPAFSAPVSGTLSMNSVLSWLWEYSVKTVCLSVMFPNSNSFHILLFH